MFHTLFSNKPLLAISFGDLLRYTAVFLVSSTAAYYFAVVLKDVASMTIYLTIQTAVGLVAAFAVNTIIKLIAMIMCLFSGICVLVSCLCIFFGYGLTEKKVTEMTEEINKKN